MKPIVGLMARIQANIARVLVGKEETVELLLAALLVGGHVLLEDVPGTGKTVLAKSLARSLDCAFSRVQFTPDLLPSDVTGTSVWSPKDGAFTFQPGPVFTSVLLADEINRATPRTQSALLECMEERQVTDGGVTRPLSAPFFVVATQNPIEIQGTFPLPEAQLDRFLMRLSPGYPSSAEAMRMLDRFIQADPLSDLLPVASREEILDAQRSYGEAHVSEPVRRYIVELCERTRAFERVQLGASPRAMLALMRASQAMCAIRERAFVTPDDVKALAEPVLAHRIIVRGLYGQGDAAREVVREALKATPVPTESRE